ncbi:uncharacterized protein DUF2489 [Chromohalobacter marismortui]|uniref:Uncharacterized protein DUF2489 n=1 Tax=Chromohalobacter marismortui TaxID=42055 RepID=A0A4R7NVN2_9GAMM|nr:MULTISPECIES: DUF2489 domain-containing protein [Chromohalobacter]MCI0511218.1 DUF2489 domain-containing protein [Chromohalobacter sp.]MCI0593903.1 DUF2489 domain-containing protein [Chromohalobacter sp.]TDU25243.1 uncharacterized protein DUF2489 [Chromohalobacter marismortui]
MSVEMGWSLVALAVLVVAGLIGYAWRLWREVQRREAAREEELARAHRNCLESLEAIATAMLGDQVDLVEGALRCKVMLDIIDPALLDREGFKVFDEIHRRTAHLHTHSSRQDLSAKQRFAEDRERIALQEERYTALHEAARQVLTFKREWPHG